MSRRSTCGVCGDPMEARRSTRRYCSTRCRVKSARVLLSVTPESAPAVVRHSTPETAASLPLPAPPEIVAPPRLPLPIEVRHVPGERLINGYPSGIGGRTTYHVAGRTFTTPRAALDFASR